MTPGGGDVGVLSPVFKVNKASLSERVMADLMSMRIERGIRQIGRMELTFDDKDGQPFERHKSAFAIGAALEATIGPVAEPVFSGVVTGLRMDYHEGRRVFTVVADEPPYVLAASQSATVYANVTDVDLTRTLLTKTNVCGEIESFSSEVHEHRLVADSPLRWLDRIADQYGVDWWCHQGKVNVGRPSLGAATTVALGREVISCSLEIQDRGPAEITARSWDDQADEIVAQSDILKPGLVPTNDTPGNALVAVVADLDKAAVGRKVAVPVTGSRSQNSIKAQSTAMTARVRESRAVLRAELVGISPSLAPRTALKLTEAGLLSATYPITSVMYLWDSRGARTQIVCGPRRPVGLAAVLASAAGSEGAPVPGGRYGGIMVGVVTNINDDKKQGRVKVKLPTLGDAVESHWARVLIPGGGNNRGMVALPQVNDQVIVGFEDQDLQRPLVLGTVYSGKNKPPTATAVKEGKAPSAGFTSATGHLVLLQDESKPAENGVRVTHSNGDQVAVMANGIEVKTASGRPVTVTAGSSSIVISDTGDITIKGQKVTIEGQTGVEIKGLEIKATAQTSLNLEAQASATLKATGPVTVESSAVTSVKGTMVQLN